MSKEPSIFFSDVNERQGSFLRRTFLVGGLTVLGIGGLSARLAQLQVFQAQEYATLASANQFNFRLVTPPRGLIRDRHGVVIAGNRPSFRVYVARDETEDMDATLDLLGRLLPDTLERRRAIIREVNAAPRFAPVPIKSDLTWEEFAKVNMFAPELPGVMADMSETRFYPHGGAYAHVIGYVAKPNDRDVQAYRDRGEEVPQLLYNPGYRVGRQGVERTFDAELRGQAGGNRVEVDVRGRVVAEDIGGSRPAVPGEEVVLTLDHDAQMRALEVFGEESGSCVAIDVRTGDILCMVSSPSFDPNLFVGGVPSSIYRAWADYERRPLLDKSITGVFPPGSTFKPVVGLAALMRGVDPNRRVFCGGGYYLGRRFACTGRHGPQDMRQAIKNSCNTYFMTIAVEMGVDPIAEVADMMGFGQTFEIGLTGQNKGLVPSTEWRRQNPLGDGDTRWHIGETPSVGIGQGALTVNALQLAVYTARIANGRKAVMPRLVRSINGVERPPAGEVRDLPFTPEMIQVIHDGMSAVTEAGGTGFRNSQLGLGAVRMAGKTGTAQSRSYQGGPRGGAGNPWSRKDHNLFVAYAPVDEPRYAVSVIVQHGGRSGGTLGAPRAREVMKVLLLKDPEIRARIEAAGFDETPTEPESAAQASDIPTPEATTGGDAAPAAPTGDAGLRPYLQEPPQ